MSEFIYSFWGIFNIAIFNIDRHQGEEKERSSKQSEAPRAWVWAPEMQAEERNLPRVGRDSPGRLGRGPFSRAEWQCPVCPHWLHVFIHSPTSRFLGRLYLLSIAINSPVNTPVRIDTSLNTYVLFVWSILEMHTAMLWSRGNFLSVLRKGCSFSWWCTSWHSCQQCSRDPVSALLAKTCHFHPEKLKHCLLFVLDVTHHPNGPVLAPVAFVRQLLRSGHRLPLSFTVCPSSLVNLSFPFFDYF